MNPNGSSVWREGAIAGLLGAAGVAAWFLGVDIVAGQAFRTPGTLGGILLSITGGGDRGTLVNTVVYTVFHVGAFLAIGMLTSKLVDLSRRVPHITIGLLLFFVVFELGFYFVALSLTEYDVIGVLGAVQIGAANLLAAALMGGYLWRRHPELTGEFKAALDGR